MNFTNLERKVLNAHIIRVMMTLFTVAFPFLLLKQGKSKISGHILDVSPPKVYIYTDGTGDPSSKGEKKSPPKAAYYYLGAGSDLVNCGALTGNVASLRKGLHVEGVTVPRMGPDKIQVLKFCNQVKIYEPY